jgi:MYXO-CTERM domain-containing protein
MPTGGGPNATGGANAIGGASATGGAGGPAAGDGGVPNAGAASTTDATDDLDAGAGCALSPAGTRGQSVGSIIAAAFALVFVGRRRRRNAFTRVAAQLGSST